jgi:DNA-binding NarL/FixJ family response regulator
MEGKQKGAQMQQLIANAETYLAPWRERMPDGKLGPEYGPRSPLAQARRLARHKNWAYKPLASTAKPFFDKETTEALVMFMRGGYGELREDVPKREREVYVLVVEQGHAVRWVARELRIRRESVKGFLRRLEKRLQP